MADLMQGAQGAAVQALQSQLIALGFLGGSADADFGPRTAQAVRDLQRRLLLRPDGVVGPATRAALAAALSGLSPFPTSVLRQLEQQVQLEADRVRKCGDPFPFLDRGIEASPFRDELPRYADRLAAAAPASELLPYPDPAGGFAPYPARGVLPQILSGRDARGGLEFLSDAVSQACLCIGSFAADQPLRVRWFGRQAVEDNVQFWSSSKFIAPLHLVCQLNRRFPGTPIGSAIVHSLDGSRSASVADLFRAMVTYKPRPGEADGGSSNRIAYMFKLLLCDGEPGVESWLRSISGNARATLMSRYGQWLPPEDPDPNDPPFFNPYANGVELRAPDGTLLVGQRTLPITHNWLSAYDLVRMISMLGWHHQLPQDCRLPGAQWPSLATLVEGLGHDPGRYLDVALERLGLLDVIAEPVILSKMGYGLDAKEGISAFNYVAFASFRDIRSRPARQRSFALALRIPTSCASELRDDARMAAEVTEIVRRIFAEELG